MAQTKPAPRPKPKQPDRQGDPWEHPLDVDPKALAHAVLNPAQAPR